MPRYGNLDKRLYNSAKRQLARARGIIREGKAIYPQNAPYFPQIPTLKELSSMSREAAVNTLAELRLLNVGRLRVEENRQDVIYTQFQRAVTERRFRIVERNKAQERALMGDISRSGLMGSERETLTRPSELNIDEMTESDFKALVSRLERQSNPDYINELQAQYFSNYIEGLYNVFGAQADDIIDVIQTMDFNDFFIASQTNETLLIDFIYDPIEVDVRHDEILKAWKRITEE